MILKIDERARLGGRQTGAPAWRYVGDVAEVVSLGFYPWDDFGPYRDDFVVVCGTLPSTDAEYADGALHLVTLRDATHRYYWFNVPEAFLLNDTGDTVDRLATGGGSVTQPRPAR